MQNKKKKYELLAPAGSFPSLVAAVNAGADAIYFGLKEGLNMRASAKNFSLDDLPEIFRICKKGKKKVKIYLTLNTIIYNNEISKIEDILKKARKYIDAVICWDFAVIQICRKHKVPFHVSTQASVANIEAAKFYKKLGADRIVLARELNLEQIKEISKIIDVECFCHGAICVSISGRCFTSQFLFGKSANRGECLQPCRRSYIVKDEDGNELKLENNTVMSAKDLCILPFIEKMKEAGIKSFKIEGRNREPEYVATVVRVYRKALDKKLSEEEIQRGLEELKKVYTKGFSSGFFLGVPTSDDFSKEQHSSATEKKEFIGKIYHYFPKINVAAIHLNHGTLYIGDEIYIIGNKTGVMRYKIERMEIDNKEVKEAKKGQNIGIKIPGARKGDDIYLIVKK
ncbi:MAG: U32 family peptidase [Candidatus Pacearchaeota archaeon]